MNQFSNSYINEWKKLEKANVGFECEFFSNHSYIKTLELMNLYFEGIEVWGINKYHSDFVVTNKIFKIEPDYSGGSDMIELITGPMQWVEAKVMLNKILHFIQLNGHTNDLCSIHINISFNDKDTKMMNPVKLITNINEDYIYSLFPERRNNIYAKSIKWVIPFEDWEDPETAINQIMNALQLPDDTKYYGVNIQKRWKGWLEYRYIGGERYEHKVDAINSLMDYFILQTLKSFEPLNDEDCIKLLSYLEDNINWYKKYKTYDDFLSNIEGISLECDTVGDYETVKMNWDRFSKKLFQIIRSTDSLKDATINWNSTTSRLEICDGIISGVHELNGIDFIGCTINDSTLNGCDIVDSTMDLGHAYSCNIYGSKVNKIKLTNCKCEEFTEITDSMFDGGFLDCKMDGGVFRSGRMGEMAEITSKVKMANKDTFWSVYDPINKKVIGKEIKK